jgi:hypothetical protein
MGCGSSSPQVATPGGASNSKDRSLPTSDKVRTITTLDDDDKNEKEHAAALKLQSFVRASLCRIRVGNYVQTLIDELLAKRAGHLQPQQEPHDLEEIVAAASVASKTDNNDGGVGHGDEPVQNETADVIVDDVVEENEDQGVFAALEADDANEEEKESKLDEEEAKENMDPIEAGTDDTQNNGDGINDAGKQQDGVDDEIPNPDEKVEAVEKVVDEEPPPEIVRSTTFVEEEDQLKEMERAEEDRLPSWWMKYAPYKILPNDEAVEQNGVVVTSTDFNAARSMFR